MDERVARLKTPQECEQFIINVKARLPELVQQARRRAVELRAAAYGAKSNVEEEALRAVYAYEETLCSKHGKKVPAHRTWRTIQQLGIIGAVDKLVSKSKATLGYQALFAIGLQDFAFEAVVLRYPTVFSEKAVARAAARLGALDAEGVK